MLIRTHAIYVGAHGAMPHRHQVKPSAQKTTKNHGIRTAFAPRQGNGRKQLLEDHHPRVEQSGKAKTSEIEPSGVLLKQTESFVMAESRSGPSMVLGQPVCDQNRQ